MPILKSAKKAMRVSRRKEARNANQKKALYDAIRSASEKDINKVNSLIDKAAKKNIIHKNKAARLKSRLARKIGQTPAGNTKHQKPNIKQTSNNGKKTKRQTSV